MSGLVARTGVGRKAAMGWGVLLLSAFVGGQAAAQCAPFPEVPWWGGLTHASIAKYVDKRHGGDWNPYIAAWQSKLQKLRDIRDKDFAAAVMSGTDKKQKRILRGVELDKYIDLVSKRLSVMRCLAKEAEKTKSLAQASRSMPRIIDPTPMAAAAGKEKAAALGCLKCHGDSPPPDQRFVPELASQNELYLIRQLKEFQSLPPQKGESLGADFRHNRIMKFRVDNLAEKDIWNLSAYFTSVSACREGKGSLVPPPAPDIMVKCVQCHGPDGKSALPDVPNLAGQDKGYLLKQLYAFRRSAEGKSKGEKIDSRYHYFISSLTRNLSDAELERLAGYFSKSGCRR
ncbi:MAG: c-type cytochrome [Rhodospirillales bacterium]|nr:c-type cytochrome [Rhodospirillales bacterium]